MLQQDEGVVQQTRAGKPPPNSSTDEESDLEEFKEISPEAITVVAVKYSLDEEFRCRCMAAGPQKYIYSFGRIGSHSLVIARPSQMGTVSAAQCAATVSQQFPNVRFAMMVGIGAGIPNPPSRDIRLGDITVSIPKDNHPGVIQYDFGKYEVDGFVLKGSLNKPPSILISADGSLEEDEMMDRSPLRKILRSITKKPGFERPDTGDNLFREDFHHVEKGRDCTECLAPGTAKLVLRPTRRRKDPVVHRGLILSGSGVVKNPQDRYRLCRNYNNAICFEMEAAGIMDEVPCLVVRGICDYADTHKQDGWHYFAAATAASYCKAVLCKFDNKSLEGISDMRDSISKRIAIVQESQLNIQSAVEEIGEKKDLARLPIAKGAALDSYENQHSQCLPGTRVELLQQIQQWAASTEGKCIFWLQGMAGTGKSTVARTVANDIGNKSFLRASFSFTRGEQDRQNGKRLFPTLIQQLLTVIPGLIPAVRQAIQDDPQISEKPLQIQFEKLLFRPILGLSLDWIRNVIIVLDALDECENENDIKLILQLLPKLQQAKALKLRFFITSRPEIPIKLGFQAIADQHKYIVLHEIPEVVIKHDILLFLEHRFSKIRQESLLRGRALPPNWPGKDTIQSIATLSVPLFIFAATLCRFVGDKRWTPEKRLAAIFEDPAMLSASEMERVYLPILNQVISGQTKREEKQLVQEFQAIVGAIVLLASPLSVNALEQLLNIPRNDINNRLDTFHSVLEIPRSPEMPVKLLHVSFRDFLLDPDIKAKSPFWVNEKEMHETITFKCLKIMQRLKFNICNLRTLGTELADINPQSIQRYISPGLQYACQYWAYHLTRTTDPVVLMKEAFLFLSKYLLPWLEAMAFLGVLSKALQMIDMLQTILQVRPSPVLI
ncbi:hypothetical protein BDV27DRAFT_166730 [Aspergillus caelatus]|uniref:NACHT domain-containing protein n=1 Tax=Aspergillus caelatus TaxID=61420 RepID=A0A5N6ZWM6_9EURO|nr:uncharacterized protein BDV27DRAFT_166730 [Aspergillus caelatus]KAE8361663.1 hypothetical protein BDV27DRAFT_166730 [Aspergillus caelatus]